MTLIIPVWELLDEFYVCFVVTAWYVGSVMGSYVASYLLSRKRLDVIFYWSCFLLILTSFLFWLPSNKAIEEPFYSSIIFCGRILGGLTSGLIYFTAVILSATSSVRPINHWVTRIAIYLTLLWILLPVTYALTTISSNSSTNRVQGEALCGLSTLIFALSILFLNSFFDGKTRGANRDDKLRLVDIQFNNYNNNNGDYALMPNENAVLTERFSQEYFDDPNVRPLVFITGAKLLSIFSSNIPFALIAFKYFHSVNEGLQDRSTSVSQCHLFALLSARLVVGALTISLNNHGGPKNSLSHNAIPMHYVLIVFGCNLMAYQSIRYVNGTVPLWSFNHFVGWVIVSVYITSSVFIDAYGHLAAVTQSPFLPLVKRPLAIAFATCIEHLIHVLFVVVYLTDVSNVSNITLFLSSFLFIAASVCFQVTVGYVRPPIHEFCDRHFKRELCLEIL